MVTTLRPASCVLAGQERALLGDGAGAVDVVDDEELVAGDGQLAQAADDDRRAGAGLGDRLAAVVEQRADAAVAGAGEDDVADVQRAVLHQHGGDGAEARVHAGSR